MSGICRLLREVLGSEGFESLAGVFWPPDLEVECRLEGRKARRQSRLAGAGRERPEAGVAGGLEPCASPPPPPGRGLPAADRRHRAGRTALRLGEPPGDFESKRVSLRARAQPSLERGL